MIRRVLPFLACLALSLTLAFAGAATVASEVEMATASGGLTLVICSGGEAKVITLNAAGIPVTPKPPHACANCSACRPASAADLPGSAAPLPRVVRIAPVPAILASGIVLVRRSSAVQARGPPGDP
jgi:hypothetical protein